VCWGSRPPLCVRSVTKRERAWKSISQFMSTSEYRQDWKPSSSYEQGSISRPGSLTTGIRL